MLESVLPFTNRDERRGETMHPCMTCGACCATYRVAFHWMETLPEAAGGGVPEALTEPLDAHRLVMAGTKSLPVCCVALAGRIGHRSRCKIYDARPSVCRAVMAAGENGQPSPQCDRARAAHGLAPLTPADWQAYARRAQTGPARLAERRIATNDPGRTLRLNKPA